MKRHTSNITHKEILQGCQKVFLYCQVNHGKLYFVYMPGICQHTDYRIRDKMDVICINDDSHTFRMCNVSFGGTKMNRDDSGFNLSNKNQLKRAIRNNPPVYNQINASLENTLNSVVYLPAWHTDHMTYLI